jgi:hypothetical protein
MEPATTEAQPIAEILSTDQRTSKTFLSGWRSRRRRRSSLRRHLEGKIRVTAGSWDGEKVFFRDQVLEARNVEGRIHVARKPRQHDEGQSESEL